MVSVNCEFGHFGLVGTLGRLCLPAHSQAKPGSRLNPRVQIQVCPLDSSGFEPEASRMQSERSTGLIYEPVYSVPGEPLMKVIFELNLWPLCGTSNLDRHHSPKAVAWSQ